MRNSPRNLVLTFVIGAFFAVPALAEATAGFVEERSDLKLTFGGFIDTYYLYDFNDYPTVDRTLITGAPFATTGERTNEFNINMAYIEAILSGNRVRGRLALQAGTSVQENYAGESAALGVIKGPVPAELIQEASVGYELMERLWIDAGIYPSYLGFEDFVSKDNWTYTRSLMADFSPYYEAGVKVSYQFSPLWSAQFHVMNGWQNIYDVNHNKSVGLQISYTPSPALQVTENAFFGNVATGGTNEGRYFNDLFAQFAVSNAVRIAAAFDVGTQTGPNNTGNSIWYGWAVFSRWQLAPKVALTGRLEEYADRNQVIVFTGTPDGFTTYGASANVDWWLRRDLLWRVEARGLLSENAVFASADGPTSTDKFLTTSLALSF